MSIETYGRYQLLKKLATGGMAQIYLARQVGVEGFEKLMVVKRILPHLAENDDFVTMFLDEARIAARLNHPNVVQIFDLGAQDDTFFIAMEYIHGEDVRRVWKHAERKGHAIPTPLICRIIIDACQGLDYAHKKLDPNGRPLNIVHRDISPQNILVSFEGHVKIVDFGIAKAADQATVTKSGVLKGKYSYMSPEQAAGKHIDNRTDLFALGVVLYELLTATRLFKRGTDIQTLNAVAECKVPLPSEVNDRVPKGLDTIVLKALARDREDRFKDALELAQALENWLLANKLPSSTVHLATFLKEIYAERLAQEADEGRLLLDSLDGLKLDDGYLDKATPSSASRGPGPTRSAPARSSSSSRSQGPSMLRHRGSAEPTAAERPSRVSGPHPRPPEAELSAVHTEASMSTQADRRPRSRRPMVLAVAAVACVAAGVGLVLLKRPPPAVVTIDSTPRGAEVTLDGAPVGCVTPCPLPERTAGQYQLGLSLDGYQPLTATIEVPETGDGTLPFTLEKKAPKVVEPPRPTRVKVAFESDPPGATLSVNGTERGLTPVTLELDPGEKLELALTLEGRLPRSESVLAPRKSGETLTYTLEPEKPATPDRPPVVKHPKVTKVDPKNTPAGRGLVRFVVKPWANVECGPGYKFGDTPFGDKEMPAGTYDCTFSNPDLGKQTKKVRVTPNETTRVLVVYGG